MQTRFQGVLAVCVAIGFGLVAGACSSEIEPPPTDASPPPGATSMPVSCNGNMVCQQLPSVGGKRPRCASPTLSTCTNNVCKFYPATTCPCYEGQSYACRAPDGGAAPDGFYGVQSCIVTSDTAATWSTVCVH